MYFMSELELSLTQLQYFSSMALIFDWEEGMHIETSVFPDH